MKKKSIYKRVILCGILVIPVIITISLAGCPEVITPSPLSAGPTLGGVGFHSWPNYFIYKDAVLDYTNIANPVKEGTEVTDAVVTVKNDDTGISATLAYTPPGESFYLVGSYTVTEDFPHTAGQHISATITAGEDTFTGKSTETPDATTAITSPSNNESISQPFDITWTTTQGTTALPVKGILYITNLTDDIYQWPVVTLNDGSYTVSGLPAGNYTLKVVPVNVMNFTNADGDTVDFVSYIATTEIIISTSVTIQ
ncbi:MAG: hypothetical protein GXP33_09140 [Spirochaetes bacterium]|nr:hypothetical protein [Spirochaetota bacterium]